MAELVVVTGPPGAGKSTIAALVADLLEPSALITGDTFFGFIAHRATAPWLPEAQAQNHVVIDAAAAATARFLAGGFHVVYDGVVGPWFLERFAGTVPDLHYVVLLPPLPTCLARVAARTGHGFTDADATRQMHNEFAGAGIAARHLVTDGEAEAAAIVDIVSARLRDGSLRLRRG